MKFRSQVGTEDEHAARPSYARRLFYNLIKLSIVSFIIASLWLWYYINNIITSLPSVDKIIAYDPPRSTIIYDSENGKIGDVAKERRVFVSIKEVPELLKQAFIAAEDKSFYENPGINLKGIMKAIMWNAIYTIRVKEDRYIGASTITQQVVRNILLSPRRTLDRKVREVILALQLNRMLSKDRILEVYLNHIYLGSRNYGVAAAARYYFDKSLHELDLPQMAVLASLPKAPSAIDPTRNKARAIQRRNWVLKRMWHEGFITEQQFLEAKEQDIHLRKISTETFGWAFVEYVKSQLLRSGISEQELETGGYTVHTTMNRAWQEIAQNALDKGINNFDHRHGYRGPITRISIDDWSKSLKALDKPANLSRYLMAVVLQTGKETAKLGFKDGSTGMIHLSGVSWARKYISNFVTGPAIESVDEVLYVGDVVAVSKESANDFILEQIPQVNGAAVIMHHDGSVAAMVGGYADVPATFNRATQALRQVGSTIKPFVYLAALEKGILPSDIFIDGPISFNLSAGQVWEPRNWNGRYLGAITLRTGLERSINTVTVRVADTIGLSAIRSFFSRMHITNSKLSDFSIVLGSVDTSLLNLASAYSTIANGGIRAEPFVVRSVLADDHTAAHQGTQTAPDSSRILDRIISTVGGSDSNARAQSQEILPTEANNTVKVIDPLIAYQMLSMLKGSVTRGASRKAYFPGINIAAKTGTSQDGESLWFVGMTPDIVIGVYLGYDLPHSTGYEFGGTASLPIFVDIMRQIGPSLPKTDFKVPEGIIMVKINTKNGKRTNKPIGNNVIYEAFKNTDELPEFEDQGSYGDKEDNSIDHSLDIGIY